MKNITPRQLNRSIRDIVSSFNYHPCRTYTDKRSNGKRVKFSFRESNAFSESKVDDKSKALIIKAVSKLIKQEGIQNSHKLSWNICSTCYHTYEYDYLAMHITES